MEEQFKDIGERLATRIKDIGLNQAELCRKTGLSTTAMSQYFTGKRIPDTTSLYKIATALDTTMEWILTGKHITIEDLIIVNKSCDNIPLTEMENDLIAMYRLLRKDDQEIIFELTKIQYEKITGAKVYLSSTYSHPPDDPDDDYTSRRHAHG